MQPSISLVSPSAHRGHWSGPTVGRYLTIQVRQVEEHTFRQTQRAATPILLPSRGEPPIRYRR